MTTAIITHNGQQYVSSFAQVKLSFKNRKGKTVFLPCGFRKIKGEENSYWFLNTGTCLKAVYSDLDIKRDNEYNALPALEHDMIVEVDGEEYKVHINGNFSDAGYLVKV